jgi:hypothetical protein
MWLRFRRNALLGKTGMPFRCPGYVHHHSFVYASANFHYGEGMNVEYCV